MEEGGGGGRRKEEGGEGEEGRRGTCSVVEHLQLKLDVLGSLTNLLLVLSCFTS